MRMRNQPLQVRGSGREEGAVMGIAWEEVVVIQQQQNEDEASMVTISWPDQAGLGCDLCRIILEFGLRISRADISTDGRWCYIVFWVLPHPPSLKLDWDSFKTRLISASPSSSFFPFNFNHPSTPPLLYLLNVWCVDQKGLLHDINQILCNLQLIIQRLKAMPTPDGRVLNMFFITDAMELLHTKKRQDCVCEYLMDALGEKCISSELQLAGPEHM
ncbi:hypothetical protein VNO78_14742 [Psophocarpus tetragonolobus]|uniref:ACT domain-containing protein ACR n=1 Tax=Psophocarpus tetragonolobus TaxID=3891 RepID=A0AAN9SDR9_PSOTE